MNKMQLVLISIFIVLIIIVTLPTKSTSKHLPIRAETALLEKEIPNENFFSLDKNVTFPVFQTSNNWTDENVVQQYEKKLEQLQVETEQKLNVALEDLKEKLQEERSLALLLEGYQILKELEKETDESFYQILEELKSHSHVEEEKLQHYQSHYEKTKESWKNSLMNFSN
ncbi:hypothetical protein [Sutcliffiella cohnii]|uniref:Uncharacterized protein n=1 Tax=Sutcliffiella cohnii TaxID=33932 RepID=A0A223KVI0_9BACI|nr:hypothetical protein [Sutcliffiella cohnii]AST93358.1 hypothetical protein BC6307_19865 [Sutcliffiella cohnii]MED4019002.1 hypothetical protein [Sutcliffiella cohnii]